MKKILVILVLFFSCNVYSDETKIDLVSKNYDETEEILTNPDRGFYKQIGGNHRFVSEGSILDWSPITVYRMYFSLLNFLDKEIDDETLIRFEEILIKAEELKITLIPRFYYFWGRPSEEVKKWKKESFMIWKKCDDEIYKPLICYDSDNKLIPKSERKIIDNPVKKYTKLNSKGKRQWKSPSKKIIKLHIEQVSEVINRNKTSISFIEAGFLGSWGEWHSDQYGHQKKWTSFRKEVVKTWLDNTDEEIFLVLRYPADHLRMKKLDGYERLGLHHDCPNYRYDTYKLKKAERLTIATPQGGEVCKIKPKGGNFDKGYSCEIMKEYFKRFNFDVLNGSDWSGSNSRFKRQGCLTEITNKLGYRFVLRGSKYENGYLYFAVENVGYGKSYKSRKVTLKVNNEIIETDIDIKNWKPDKVYLEKIFIGADKSGIGELIIEDDIKFANKNGNEIYLY